MRALPGAAILTLAISVPAAGEELWRGPAGQECNLLLINEIGDVRVGVSSPANLAPAVFGAPELTIDTASSAAASSATASSAAASSAAASSAAASRATASSAAAINDRETRLTVTRQGDTASGDTASSAVTVSVPSGCSVRVRTADGSVAVEIGPAAFPLAVDTVTGDVTERIDPAADATIMLATSGEITTDYTIEVDFRYHAEPAKHGRVAIGRGTTDNATGTPTEVHLTSRRGAVRVLRPAEGPDRP